MSILHVGQFPLPGIYQRWRQAGLASRFIDASTFRDCLDSRQSPDDLAECVVTFIAPSPMISQSHGWQSGVSSDFAASLRKSLRSLPDNVAMIDGRKWSRVPIVLLHMRWERGDSVDIEADPIDVYAFDLADAGPDLLNVVLQYRERILTELRHLGFLVSLRDGRFVIGPAYHRKRQAGGEFYNGSRDQQSGERILTTNRDLLGLQHEVEVFEELINRPTLAERDLQLFFEANPHFLSTFGMVRPLAQPRFKHIDGRILIPDFVLQPVVASQRDDNWEVLDLKLPQSPLVVGPEGRRRLSAQVYAAIRQLRDYGDFFADQRHVDQVTSTLGHPLQLPRLAVLIGRLPSGSDLRALSEEQHLASGIRIVTYDEILEQQRAQIDMISR
jgi:hypothetical protein